MKRSFSIIFMIIALVLMCLPSLPVRYNDGVTVFISKHPYYDLLLPFGGAVYYPILTFLLSIIITTLLILIKIKGKTRCFGKTKTIIKILLIVCLILSVLSWIFVQMFTITGLIIALLHISTFVLQIIDSRHI